MQGLNLTELEPGEEIVFGPVTSTKTTSLSGGAGPSQGSISRSSGRTVAVTNRRVIIEDLDDPSRSRVVPNSSVERLSIKRKKEGITIARVQTASGSLSVNLPGVGLQQEPLLATTFPNAELEAQKGVPKGVIIAASVVVGLVALCCIVFVVGAVVAK